MDHLSSNILMCAMLLLFYASGTVEGAVFDEACGDGTACTGTNVECSSSKCACTSASFRDKDNNECVTKVILEATCGTGESADQCADVLAECREGSGLQCLCKAANYKSGSACKVKVILEATCGTGESADQCADVLAECREGSGLQCLCKAANYKSGSACKVKVDIEGVCDIADTATDQCSVTNTVCRDDGNGAKQCLCSSDHYRSGSTCLDRKKPDADCESGQCVTNAMCSTSDKCACNTGYEATPTTTPTSCESSDATIIIAHLYVFMFGIVASLYFLV